VDRAVADKGQVYCPRAEALVPWVSLSRTYELLNTIILPYSQKGKACQSDHRFLDGFIIYNCTSNAFLL
jgi:hypothetical protein